MEQAHFVPYIEPAVANGSSPLALVPEPGVTYRVGGWEFDSAGRPRACRECGGEKFYVQEDAYVRTVLTLIGYLILPVDRFFCRNRKCRASVVRNYSFVGKGCRYALDVRRAVLERATAPRSTRGVSDDVRKERRSVSPRKSTIHDWEQKYGKVAGRVHEQEVLPGIKVDASTKVQADEHYPKGGEEKPTKDNPQAGKIAVVASMIYQTFFVIFLFAAKTATKAEAERMLLFIRSKLGDIRWFITDEAQIWLEKVKEVFPDAEHLLCIFHLLRNLGKTQRKMSKAFSDEKRAEVNRLLALLNEQLAKMEEQIARQPRIGFVTNNHLELFFRHLKRACRMAVKFGDVETATRFLTLVMFRWNFTRFERGKRRGRCPAELAGFDPKGKDWLEMLGLPGYGELYRRMDWFVTRPVRP